MKLMGIIMYCVIAAVLLISTVLIVRVCMKSKKNGKINNRELITGISLIVFSVIILIFNKENRYIFRIVSYIFIMPGCLSIYKAVVNNGRAKGIAISLFMIIIVVPFSIFTIGIPNEPPVITLDETDLIVGKTKVIDLLEDDFNILVRSDDIEFSGDLYIDDILDRYQVYDGSTKNLVSTSQAETLSTKNIGRLSDTRATFYIEKDNLIYGTILVRIEDDNDLKNTTIFEYAFYKKTYGENETLAALDKKLNIQLNGRNIFTLTEGDFLEMYPKTEPPTIILGEYDDKLQYSTRTNNSTTYNYSVDKYQSENYPVIQVSTNG